MILPATVLTFHMNTAFVLIGAGKTYIVGGKENILGIKFM